MLLVGSDKRHIGLFVSFEVCEDFVERDWSGASKMLVGLEHIYIFSLHVFNEIFQLEAFLKDISRLGFFLLVKIGGRFCFSEERHVVLQLVVFLVFL